MTLRWGVVGFGWVASDFMAPAIRDAGHVLVGVCDPSSSAREKAKSYDAQSYASVDELASDAGVDAVYVATPNHLHRTAVEFSARAGKSVLCEKPTAHTMSDAQAMANACNTAGVLYATAFDQRHHPAHAAIRDAVSSGLIGTVTAIRIVYACWVDPLWRTSTGSANWRSEQNQAGGGALVDLAPHGLDLIDYLVGEPILAVAATMQQRVHSYDVEDGAMIVGSTAGGVLASLHVGYNYPEALPRRRLEIVGDKGQLTAIDTMGQQPGGTVTHTDGITGISRRLTIPDSSESPFLRQARAFAKAHLTGDRSAFCSKRDLHTMKLIEQAYQSSQEAAQCL